MLRSLGLNYDIFGGRMGDFLDYFIERSYPPSATVSELFCAPHRRAAFSQPLSSMLNNCEGEFLRSSLIRKEKKTNELSLVGPWLDSKYPGPENISGPLDERVEVLVLINLGDF